MVIVPVRVDPELFGATLKESVPLPVPDAPDVIVSQPSFEAAVHPQFDALAVTVTVPDPPPAGKS